MLLLNGLPVGADEELQQYQFEQIRMGIPVKLTLYAPDEAVANKAAEAAYARFRELDRMLSDYDPESELMRLCQRPAGTPIKVSPELGFVLDESLNLATETTGAFDISVGPLVKLWRVARRRQQLPDAERLAAARALVGYQHMQRNVEDNTVVLNMPGMQLDLGAIAKGYAADEALRVMRQQGVSRVLIDAGGDLVLGDPPPGRDHWSIAIEPLRLGQSGTVPVFLSLKNCAVATSGDAYQHVEIAGVRYSHIVDPRTGLGLTELSSVTIIAPTGLEADALATTVSVLGPQAGLTLVAAHSGCELMMVVATQEDAEVQTHASPGFATFRGTK